MKNKVHRLSLDLEYDFDLIGISSSENDYKISWKINKEFHLKLTKAQALTISNKRFKEDQHFSLYTFEDHEHFDTFNLISNRGDKGYLIEELKNIDFFLQIHGLIDHNVKDQIVAKLKAFEGINSVFVIDPNDLASKEKLLF